MNEYLEVEFDIKPTKKGLLSGYTVSFKDCICIEGVETKSSSQILKGYKPSFDSFVVKKVKEEGGHIIGKTKQDEFGFGSFGLNHKEPPRNPLDNKRVCGGSSSGSAGISKVLDNHIAIAESTGGSIVNPAAFCGVVGFCPSYGLVSRHGLLDYGTSLDKIGVISKDVLSVLKGLEVISSYDGKDSTQKKLKPENFSKLKAKKDFKIGIPKEYLDCEEFVKESFLKVVDLLTKKGIQVDFISLENNFKYSVSCYYLIACSEASTNLAKYSGLRYGIQEDPRGIDFNDYFKQVRSKHFSTEAKRRIILGTFARMEGNKEDFYDKALMVRNMLLLEYKKVFEKYDLILHPTMPILPPKIDEAKKLDPKTVYNMDLLTVGSNLSGLPHASIPYFNNNNLPIGVMVTGNSFEEKKIAEFLLYLEEVLK